MEESSNGRARGAAGGLAQHWLPLLLSQVWGGVHSGVLGGAHRQLWESKGEEDKGSSGCFLSPVLSCSAQVRMDGRTRQRAR